MILSFGAQNFFSFAEGFEFSFNCGKNAANVMGIKGANASGKTNVLRALAFIGYFANSTFDLKPDEDILVQPFLDNKKSSSFLRHHQYVW